jgi:type IV secretory pathway VirB3-like protein
VTPSNCRFFLGIRVSLIVLYLIIIIIIIIIINKQIIISLLFLIEDIQKTLILCSNSKYTLALGCMVRERKKIK